ncbi:MAG: gliding motility-associated C-terminal domain-containing protein [Bacteroidales bacterium]|nr:gliding motility-associated C-terminal domain-containing protein [Bacteroidales bacterium]MCF8402903.1 gliding motility-associated C-terminal domain-containing protein [Bacteroidales bacterium]
MIQSYTKNVSFFYKSLLGIFILLSCTAVKTTAQLFIAPGPDVTPMDMVENIVGDGIIFDNVQFQGADPMRGIFTNGATTNLGINSGIFLCSGSGYLIPGPNYQSSAGSNMGLPGHPSLDNITTSTTYDAAVLSFDFVPESDTLRFKYVFGSEEYNEYVNSSFNDVFGYFVTGPNPEGGTYNDKNVAVVPGTNITVTINNVNNGWSPSGVPPTGPCENCDYYTDNTNGVTLEYDGKTTVMTAWLLVVPCETYSIKIGVADAGDHIFDSGVFIKENSFESPKIEVETDPYPQGVSDNMIEGCVEADIIFKLPDPDYAPVTVYWDMSESTANPAAFIPDGGDFEEEIPDSLVFEMGQDSVAIHVIPVYDELLEGIENLRLIITNTLGCIVRYDTVDFIISDYIAMEDTISPPTVICQGQSIDIWVNTFNGIPPYTFEWEDIPENNDTITVMPLETTTYYVEITDMCLDSIIDSTTVTVFPLPELDLGPDTGYMCNGDTLVLSAGAGYLGYFWQDGSSDTAFAVVEEGLYFVTVFGPGGCASSDSVYVIETFIDIDLGSDTTICIGDSVVFDPGGGYPSYVWQDGTENQTYMATQTGTYWVEVSLGACSVIDSVYLYVDDPSIALSLGEDTIKCIEDAITLSPAFGIFNSYLWNTGDTTMSITVTQPGTYTLNVISGCGEASDEISVSNYPYPNPGLGDDQYLCFGQSAFLEANFGFATYQWQDNSTLNFYTASETGYYYIDVEDSHGCFGTDTVYVEIGDIVDLGEDSLILCEGETITLNAGAGFDTYVWESGSNSQTIDVTTGGLYKVFVSYVYGCQSEDSVLIEQFPIPVAEITGDNALCTGDTVWLNAGIGDYEYFWNGVPSNEMTYMVSGAENVTLKVSNVCGEDTKEFEVVEHELPTPDLGLDIVLFPDESAEFNAGNYETYTWWGNGSENGQYYTITFNDISTAKDSVVVEVFDGFCKNSDIVYIEVFKVEVPNAMTPNGDGANDRFEPLQELSGINDHTMVVFNRWGEKVWESTDFASGWDGKKDGKYVADGTYFWILDVYYGPGNTKKVYKGTLTVLGSN